MTLSTGRSEGLVINLMVLFSIRGEFGMAITAILFRCDSPLVDLLEMPETLPVFTEHFGHLVTFVTADCFRFEETSLWSGKLCQDRTCCNPAGEDAGAEKRPFQGGLPVDAGESRQLPDGVQAGNGFLLAVEYPAVQVDRDASHTFAC